MGSRRRRRRRANARGRVFVVILVLLLLAGAVFGAHYLYSQGKGNQFAEQLSKNDFEGAKKTWDEAMNPIFGWVSKQTEKLFSGALEKKIDELAEAAQQGPIDVAGTYAGLSALQENALTLLEGEIEKVTKMYTDGMIQYDRLVQFYENIRQLGFVDLAIDKFSAQAGQYYQSQDQLRQADQMMSTGDYLGALAIYESIPPQDEANYKRAQEALTLLAVKLREQALLGIGEMLGKNKFDEAMEIVETARRFYPDDQELGDAKGRVEQARAQYETDLVPYTGPVEHIFFHCLIAYPELCYSSPSMMQSLDRDCVTPREFTACIEQLYANGYVLIDINLLYGEREQDGQTVAVANQLTLPRGKKPLVLSIDDVTYDARKMGTGMVDKLILDESGNIATYTKMADGSEQIRYDNEIFPMLDAFVEEHPDFSFQGAKGTLCLTGFQGILGYRTQHDTPDGFDRQSEIEQAKKVVARLKETGWTFASHSYGHRYMNSKASLDLVRDDTQKWHDEVESLVGPTNIFVFPYGESVRPGTDADAKYQVLLDFGFRVFCGVGYKQPFLTVQRDGKSIFQDRRNVDGYTLRKAGNSFDGMFEIETVIDPVRPVDLIS